LSAAFANPCAERTSTIELAGCEARLLVISGDDLLALRRVALRRLRFKVALRAPSARLRRRGFAFRFAAFVLFNRYGGFAAKVKQCLALALQFCKKAETLQACKVRAQGLMVCIAVAQRFALAAGGRAWILFGSRKKPEARKMPVSRDESHQSAARFVSPLPIYRALSLLRANSVNS
jgi:hypothetical protein